MEEAYFDLFDPDDHKRNRDREHPSERGGVIEEKQRLSGAEAHKGFRRATEGNKEREKAAAPPWVPSCVDEATLTALPSPPILNGVLPTRA